MTQIAVSLVLLVAAGLFVRSLMRLEDVDLGFDPNQVVLFRVSPPADQQPLPAETKRQLYRQLLERAVNVPGVAGASAAYSGLLSSETWRNVVTVEGFTPPDGRTPRTFVNAVTPTYFDVMRIAMLRGRSFKDDDRQEATTVAIVNDAFARQFFGGVVPIGRRAGLCSSESCDPTATRMMEIVGVAEDAKYSNLRADAPAILYVPFTQVEANLGELQVRTTGDVAAVGSTLYRVLADVDPRLAIVGMITARDRVDASLATPNMVARLSSLFALLALALAAVGLCGLVAYVTAQRTQEIGVRMALGAGRRDVRRLVLGNTVRLVALGAGLESLLRWHSLDCCRVCCIRSRPTIPWSCRSASECLPASHWLRDTCRHSEPHESIRSRRYGPSRRSHLAARMGRNRLSIPNQSSSICAISGSTNAHHSAPKVLTPAASQNAPA